MNELMTIGYEMLPPGDFLEILKRNKVSMVVDVRELPLSRKRGFSKSALSTALAAEGIGYLHLRALGCPRKIRHAHRVHKLWARYTRAYKAYLETQMPVVKELARLTAKQRCCLLCVEKDWNACHRNYVAQRVASIATPPLHILHLSGAAERH